MYYETERTFSMIVKSVPYATSTKRCIYCVVILSLERRCPPPTLY